MKKILDKFNFGPL